MLFDKKYDDGLWHIIKCDRKHRKEIIEMIKSLPKEFIEEIRRIIKRQHESELLGEICEDECGVIYLDDGTYYSYSVSQDDELILCKGITVDGHDYDKFEINLEYNDYDDLENYCEEWIGDTTVYSSEEFLEEIDEEGNREFIASLLNCTEDEYNVIRTPIGNIVYFNRESELTEKSSFHFGIVSRKRIPKDLQMSDLDRLNNGMTLRRRKEQ